MSPVGGVKLKLPGAEIDVRTPEISMGEREAPQDGTTKDVVFTVEQLRVAYGAHVAVMGVALDIEANQITAIIGPSGCGKSTLIRCFNRMNDLIPGARIEGRVLYRGHDLYAEKIDPVEVRRR